MEELLPSIRHNLARLFQFRGRASNRQFWPWAILVCLAHMAGGILITVPMMADMMTRAIEIGQSAPSDGGKDPEIVAAQIEGMMKDSLANLEGLWLSSLIMQAVAIFLVAAAVARRLHDRDRSALWGLMPIPFAAIGIVNIPLAGDVVLGRPLSALEAASVSLGYGYWIALLVLIVILAGKGDEAANRFGPAPTAEL